MLTMEFAASFTSSDDISKLLTISWVSDSFTMYSRGKRARYLYVIEDSFFVSAPHICLLFPLLRCLMSRFQRCCVWISARVHDFSTTDVSFYAQLSDTEVFCRVARHKLLQESSCRLLDFIVILSHHNH